MVPVFLLVSFPDFHSKITPRPRVSFFGNSFVFVADKNDLLFARQSRAERERFLPEKPLFFY